MQLQNKSQFVNSPEFQSTRRESSRTYQACRDSHDPIVRCNPSSEENHTCSKRRYVCHAGAIGEGKRLQTRTPPQRRDVRHAGAVDEAQFLEIRTTSQRRDVSHAVATADGCPLLRAHHRGVNLGRIHARGSAATGVTAVEAVGVQGDGGGAFDKDETVGEVARGQGAVTARVEGLSPPQPPFRNFHSNPPGMQSMVVV